MAGTVNKVYIFTVETEIRGFIKTKAFCSLTIFKTV